MRSIKTSGRPGAARLELLGAERERLVGDPRATLAVLALDPDRTGLGSDRSCP
jgi:hypothetical protein